MHCLEIDPDRAAAALERLHVHVPNDVAIARIVAAKAADTEHEQGVAFMAEDGQVFWAHHGRGVRYIETAGGLAELTTWCWRIETSREIAPTE